jgi:hypothetical protein
MYVCVCYVCVYTCAYGGVAANENMQIRIELEGCGRMHVCMYAYTHVHMEGEELVDETMQIRIVRCACMYVCMCILCMCIHMQYGGEAANETMQI